MIQPGFRSVLPAYGGFENQVAWGKHLVTISGPITAIREKKWGHAVRKTTWI